MEHSHSKAVIVNYIHSTLKTVVDILKIVRNGKIMLRSCLSVAEAVLPLQQKSFDTDSSLVNAMDC